MGLNRKRKGYVMHVMGMHSTKFGGLERFLISLADSLDQYNIGLIVIYNSIPLSNEFVRKLEKHNVELVISDALKPFSIFTAIARLIFKYKIIVIHSHFQPVYSSISGWILGCRNRWVTLHVMLISGNFEESTNTKGLRLSTKIHRSLIRLFTTKFLAVSKQVSDQYSKIYPASSEKYEIYYLGIEENIFNRNEVRLKLNFEAEMIYIVSIGFATHIKGLDILIKAADLLVNHYHINNINVCIIGCDEKIEYTQKLKELAKSYSLENKIIWFGIKDNVPELISAMDIYVQPSRTEALPMSIMEAGIAGLPCIGSDVGGIKEVITHNETGFLFKSEDVNELTEYLKRLIDDVQLRKKFGIMSKKHMMTNFNREVQINQLCNMYNSILKH